MNERRAVQRGRTFLGGKIIFNAGRSAIDCKVRDLSNDGACLEVESQAGIPVQFQLLVADDEEPRACKLAWQSDHRMGVSFERRLSVLMEDDDEGDPGRTEPERTNDLLRSHLLALRAALDESPLRRGAAGPGASRAVHQPRLPQDVASAGPQGRRQATVRRPDVSRPRHQSLRHPGRRSRRLHRRTRRARQDRRSDAARRTARQRRGVAHAMRDPAERRPHAELHARHRHCPALRRAGGAESRARQGAGWRHPARCRPQRLFHEPGRATALEGLGPAGERQSALFAAGRRRATHRRFRRPVEPARSPHRIPHRRGAGRRPDAARHPHPRRPAYPHPLHDPARRRAHADLLRHHRSGAQCRTARDSLRPSIR